MSLTDQSLVRKLEAILELARAQGRTSETGVLHEIGLKEAAFILDVSESQMRRLCQKNVHGIHPDGYGRKQEGSNLWSVITWPFFKALMRPIERFREPAVSAEKRHARGEG